ncbi:MAG: hypothetical protein JNM70_12525 [Anaerolineae bacterium]|nr:hypothetical protein [Anaerolineae bacterium]
MGIDLYWDDEAQTVLLLEINGPWRWEELRRTLATVHKLTAQADPEVGALIDVRKGLFLSAGTLFSADGLANARSLLTLGTDEPGPVVVVGTNPLVRSVYEAFAKLDGAMRSRVRFADTLDEAREVMAAWLAERRE